LVTGDDDKDIWVLDLERGTRTRLTFGGDQTTATWNPDGSQVAVSLNHDIYLLSVDGSGELEALLTEKARQWPSSWSPDGKALAYIELNSATGFDAGVLSLDDGAGSLFLNTPFKETGPKFSPDGRWLAYTSDESGRDEVYVRPYPGPGKKALVSTNGGSEPTWSGDGREIFYRLGKQVLAVETQTEPEFRAGPPHVLFEGLYDLAPYGEQHYDVSPDGQQFAMIRLQALPQVNINLHWLEELKTLVPN
jgi:Tol biopolymer transport system component